MYLRPRSHLYILGSQATTKPGLSTFPSYFIPFVFQQDSNSDWTFIVLNLPFTKRTPRSNRTKKVNQFQCPGTEKRSSTTENVKGMIKTKVGMPWCTGRF